MKDYKEFKNDLNKKTNDTRKAELTSFFKKVYPDGMNNELIVLTGKSAGSVLGSNDGRGFSSGVCKSMFPEQFHTPYFKKKEKNPAGKIVGPLPACAKYDFFWEGRDMDARVLSYSIAKISPVREKTPSLADIVVNTNHKVGALYANTTTHFPPFRRADKSFSYKNIRQCHCIVVDVDNFPLDKYETADEKYAAVKENYPFLSEFRPTFITDTGKKGFQVFYCFYQDISGNNHLKRFLTGIITIALDADPCCVKTIGQFRVPYSTRADGNECTIIHKGYSWDYKEFSEKLGDFIKFYCVTDDNRIVLRDEVFSDDIYLSFKDYVCETFHVHPFTKSVARKAAVRKPGFDKKREKKHHYLYDRVIDLKEALNYRAGNMYGARNCFLYDYGAAVWFTYCGMGKKENAEAILRGEIRKVNNQFTVPLSEQEVHCIIRSLLKGAKIHNNAYLGEMYGLKYIPNTKCSYTREASKIRKKAYDAKRYEPVKREVLRKRTDRIIAFVKAAMKESSVTKLSRMLGLSRQTIYNYFDRYGWIVKLFLNKKESGMGKIVESAVKDPVKAFCRFKDFKAKPLKTTFSSA